MARKTAHRRHKKGGSGNINLPYSSTGGRRHRRKMRGGSDGGSGYTSASTYNTYVNGSGDSQYDRTFSTSGGYSNIQGNLLIGAQGQNTSMAGVPNANSLSLIQSAGSRRRKSKYHTKRRRGGFLGQVVNQAIVPFGILGMQQSYRRNKSNKTFKRYRK